MLQQYRGPVLIAFATVLAGCVHSIDEPTEAIAAADKFCGKNLARFHQDSSAWRANLIGDHWHVVALSYSFGGHSHSFYVDVPRDGSPIKFCISEFAD